MKTQQPLQLKLGFCPFTGNQIGEMKDGVFSRFSNFGKFWLLMSNGQKMEVWIDKNYKPTKKDAQRLLEAHLVYWENAYKAEKKQLEEKYNQFKNLSLVAYGRREKDLQK